MKDLLLTQCENKLDFLPMHASTHQAVTVCWRKIQLNRFSFDLPTAVELSGEYPDLADLLRTLYPQLSFIEVARIHDCSRALNLDLDLTKLAGLTNSPLEPLLADLCDRVLELPSPLQNRLAQKGLSAKQLQLFLEIDFKPYQLLWLKISEADHSRSDLAQMIEWAGEVILFGRYQPNLLQAQDLKKALHQLRFPELVKRDGAIDHKYRRLSWPKKSQWAAKRQGDRVWSELTLKFTNIEDLRTQANRLIELKEPDL